jgi:very-short-patch-repair endonuclease
LGYDGRREYGIWTIENYKNTMYFYDFTIPDFKLIFEYQGSKWHPDYRLTEQELFDWKTPRLNDQKTAYDVQLNDSKKRNVAEQHGFKVIDLWGSDPILYNQTLVLNELKQKGILIEMREF